MAEKTVLIITNAFPPSFAPRMGYLSKYLAENGWKGIAIAPFYDNCRKYFDFLSEYIPCKRVYISKRRKNIIHKALSFFFPDLRIPWELKKKMRFYCDELISKEQIDIILCAAGLFFPLCIAYKVAKKYKIPWIADLRDIEEQHPEKNSFLMDAYYKMVIFRRNYLLRDADAITVASEKHVEILNNYALKAYCIYNGADADIFFPTKKRYKLNEFTIVYTGTIYSRLGQDVSPLFSVIKQLYISGDIDLKNCRIKFYTDIKSQEVIKKSKEIFSVSEFVECFDVVPATEIPKILNESSILLLLLNRRNTGIMTTKFFEYLAVGCPILCIWNDEGAVKEIINNSKAGIAAKTEQDIKQFIKSKYDEWLKTGYINSDIDRNYIKNFSRKYNAKQFVELFGGVLKSKNLE